MKRYEFFIPQHSSSSFFKPIRNKLDVIELLMKAIRLIYASYNYMPNKQDEKMILSVGKMSRLFFFSPGKYFSISFPFSVSENKEGVIEIASPHFELVGQELVSHVLSVISCKNFDSTCSIDFCDPIADREKDYDQNFWVFLKDLLMVEDGYIRYDIDKKNFKDYKARGEEAKHPLFHYDVFYTNKCTFKLGIDKRITEDELIDLLDITTDCKFLS